MHGRGCGLFQPGLTRVVLDDRTQEPEVPYMVMQKDQENLLYKPAKSVIDPKAFFEAHLSRKMRLHKTAEPLIDNRI